MATALRSWVVWGAALAAGGVGAWLLHGGSQTAGVAPAGPGAAGGSPAVPTVAVAPPVKAVEPVPSSAASASAALADRFKLAGVMSHGGQDVAMIAVEGQPARAFRVGDALGGGLIVREISSQGATIGSRDGEVAAMLPSTPQAAGAMSMTGSDGTPSRNLADGSAESEAALRKMGARHLPGKAPTAAEQASAAEASVPTDPGRWRPPGQP